MEPGDEIIEIEGHSGGELTLEEAEALCNLKANYLRLGVRRPKMFSNQYMGTRQASKSLPRFNSSLSQYGLQSRLDTKKSTERPVNAQQDVDNKVEEVDYSFMQLPVRERRKLFLGESPTTQVAYGQSFTLPRQRIAATQMHNQFETQSEYGGPDNTYKWEPMVTPSWTRVERATSGYNTPKSRSTKTFHLTNNPVSIQHTPERPLQYQRQYTMLSQSPQRNQNSYTTSNQETVRVLSRTTSSVHPVRRYSSIVPTVRPITQSTYYPMQTQWTTARRPSGYTVQPLRVNVYNSDSTTTYSPYERAERVSNWTQGSPIYPAYPAHLDQPTYMETQPMRYRREQTVQPNTLIKSQINQSVETRQTWKPMEAPRWLNEASRVPRQGTFITTTKRISGHQHTEPSEILGASDF